MFGILKLYTDYYKTVDHFSVNQTFDISTHCFSTKFLSSKAKT